MSLIREMQNNAQVGCDLCIIGDLLCILGNNAHYASAEFDNEQSLVTDNRLSQVTTLHSLQATAS